MAVAFCSGVFQVCPSTPGVRLPVFCVTRLTASALPLNECVSKRCKAFTLPHLPCWVACAIRVWSRRTFRSARRQLRWCHAQAGSVVAPTEGSEVVSSVVSVVICFTSLVGYSDALAPKDQREVCPLARGMIFPCGATPLCPITEQLSLLPSSFAGHAIGGFCNPLSCDTGAWSVYHVPHMYHAWVR